jgi:hypothetical protein
LTKNTDAPALWRSRAKPACANAIDGNVPNLPIYNYPGGCADEVAQAQALIDGLVPDPGCAGARMKIVLSPDPSLEVRWAASAWTWTLRAACFDKQAFALFVDEHYQGPDTELACDDGADLSASGWCH